MRRAAAALAALALSAVPFQASAQTGRDGAVEQAVVNTLGAHLQKRGYELHGDASLATLGAVADAIERQTNACASGVTQRTWQQTIKCLADKLPFPIDLGKEGQKFTGYQGGDFGGGGASGSWGEVDHCGNIDIKLDAQGYLIIPSHQLEVGGPMPWGTILWINGWIETRAPRATSSSAASRRGVHILNMKRGALMRNWFGVIGPRPGQPHVYDFAMPAWRDEAGVLHGREVVALTAGASVGYYGTGMQYFDDQDVQCPEGDAGGSDFHFYGEALHSNGAGAYGDHIHQCIMYFPNPQLSSSGYAINAETSVDWGAEDWPNRLPPWYRDCALDPSFVRRLTDALYKDATEQPGYTGAPYQPVTSEDSRPGDTKIGDLGDNPTGGNTAPPPDDGVNEPPPSNPPPTGGGSDECDFKGTASGCTDPGTGQPTVDDPPTGIMDPIFAWLPDLPSITLNTAETTCPVWNINLTEYAGPQWQFNLDGHCQLFADPDVIAMINVLMIAVFGIGAATIILRA